MSNYKIEITITGQLIGKGYYVSLEGREVFLKEEKQHIYARTFDAFPVDEPLDVVIILNGLFGTEWTVDVKVNGTSRISDQGTFPVKGNINIVKHIQLP
jgi:hypothetical protein